MLNKKTKKRLILILSGMVIFIVFFVLLVFIGSLSLPKTSIEVEIEEYGYSFPTGGDSVRIKDDLIFFWPLMFSKNYYPESGKYAWRAIEGCPPSCNPSGHPLVLLYWAFVSFMVSLLVVFIAIRIIKKYQE